jgi:hypothetical protein
MIGGLMRVCEPPPLQLGCVHCTTPGALDPWLLLWALLMLLLVLGTALSVLSASHRVSRVERRLRRHLDRQFPEETT